MRAFIVFLFLGSISVCKAQSDVDPTTIQVKDLEFKRYEKDSSARAVVLHEFGEAHISPENFNLIFEHHIKIKVLKKDGSDQGDFSIPLYKSGTKAEQFTLIQASTFNMEGGNVKESKLNKSSIFTETINEHWTTKKFTLPNVKVGTIIKVRYQIESPFLYNFRQFEFQSDIPKILSEYWAKIPGNYVYNISLKGYQNLSKNESSVISKCIEHGSSGYDGSGYSADCALYKYAMKNVPAFYEEEHMTAKKNFISSINFELSQVKYFDGRVDNVTKTWRDAEVELRKEDNFGVQLKKGKDIGKKLEEALSGITDPEQKARKIYSFMQTWYKWNEVYGFICDVGVKKSFEGRSGNIADINLALVAALKYAGLDADPVLLSTRANGLVTELYPVLSEFNYVVAKVTLNNTSFLLDATDPLLPFGLLPKRCLNGKGRVLGEKSSDWYDLKPSEKSKKVTVLNLTLQPSGVFSGSINMVHTGYSAFEKRKEILSFSTHEEYIRELQKEIPGITINKYEFKGIDSLGSSVSEKFEVEIEGLNNLNARHSLNPFLTGKIKKNPFRSKERLYPVDFGAPLESTVLLSLNYPESIELESAPEKVALSLPNGGGKFLFDVATQGNTVTMNYQFAINKTVYNSQEYHYLKELYNRLIQVQQTDFIFKKK